MKRLFLAFFALACAFAVQGLSAQSVQAQGYSDDDYGYTPRRYRPNADYYFSPYEYRKRRRRTTDGCRATIRATGRGWLTGFSARTSAINAWRREARAVYGRDFSWDAARSKDISCAPYLATQRCTASGRPC